MSIVRMKAGMPAGEDARIYDGLKEPSRQWKLGDEIYIVARCAVDAVEERLEEATVYKLAIEHVELPLDHRAILDTLTAAYDRRTGQDQLLGREATG